MTAGLRARGRAVLLGVIAAAGCMQTPAALPVMQLDPIRVGPPGTGALGPVSFLTGCWRGPTSDGVGVYEERFTPPAAGIMLGTSRMWAGSELRSFEYLTLRAVDDGVVLVPSPGGRPAGVTFPLTASGPGVALFEAPDHDYPRRIRYSTDPDGALHIRIDAGADDPDPRSWVLRRVDCPS